MRARFEQMMATTMPGAMPAGMRACMAVTTITTATKTTGTKKTGG